MEPAWKNKPSPGQEAKRAKAKDAYYAGSWIYVPEKDLWLSPEEFMQDENLVTIHRGADNTHKFKIRDPKTGILEKSKRVTEAQKQLNEFIERVDRYFELKPIRK